MAGRHFTLAVVVIVGVLVGAGFGQQVTETVQFPGMAGMANFGGQGGIAEESWIGDYTWGALIAGQGLGGEGGNGQQFNPGNLDMAQSLGGLIQGLQNMGSTLIDLPIDGPIYGRGVLSQTPLDNFMRTLPRLSPEKVMGWGLMPETPGGRGMPNPPLADVFQGMKAEDGFSGVFDASTGKIGLSPSSYAQAQDLPTGVVPARGGHRLVSQALGGDPANHWGFAAILEGDGTLRVTWYSGTLNSRAPGAEVPASLRATIVEALEEQSGKIVSSY